jgi:DNA recombination protein RmuC
MPSSYMLLLAAWLLGLVLGAALTAMVAARRIHLAQAELIRLQAQYDAMLAAREDLVRQFEILAAQTLDTQSQKFTAQNREALSALLSPLGERIADFRQKVEQVHLDETKQRSALKAQVEELSRQSRDIGLKADHLADALKGDNKAVGNWGELVLERLLETSGLQLGRDYDLQVSVTEADGRRYQPDAVIRLPENRCILIDAKMSLQDYLDHVNAGSDEERDAALKAHVASIETHIKNLTGKAYQDLDAFRNRSPDFVLLFVPSEPAFSLALSARPALFETAARAGAILVGPGGLLATLRLIDQIWRLENQRGLLNEIFDAVRKIYEKYVGFTEDMQRIDDSLQKARDAYAAALRKLATGDGNLLRQMNRFVKENYIKPKRLPPPAFRPGGPPPATEDAATPSR